MYFIKRDYNIYIIYKINIHVLLLLLIGRKCWFAYVNNFVFIIHAPKHHTELPFNQKPYPRVCYVILIRIKRSTNFNSSPKLYLKTLTNTSVWRLFVYQTYPKWNWVILQFPYYWQFIFFHKNKSMGIKKVWKRLLKSYIKIIT